MNQAVIKLPAFSEPESLDGAKVSLLNLGRSLHEHAYMVGRLLRWIKNEVEPGNFETWIKSNVWFGERTAQRMMKFSVRCDGTGLIESYEPRKGDTVTVLDPNPLQTQEAETEPDNVGEPLNKPPRPDNLVETWKMWSRNIEDLVTFTQECGKLSASQRSEIADSLSEIEKQISQLRRLREFPKSVQNAE